MISNRSRSAALQFLLVSLLAIFVVLAYVNGLHGPFMLDDTHEIVTNQSIENIHDPLSILRYNPTRPLTNLSYAVDYALWSGRNEFGFHITNLVLHVINVLLLFVMVRDLARSTRPGWPIDANVTAFVAASLFAVHPLMTEAVTYISGRSDLLATTFILLSLYCFRQGFDNRSWLIPAFAAFIFALATKETAAMLPFLLLASDILASGGSEWRRRLWPIHAPLLSIVIAGTFARIALYVTQEANGSRGFTWSNIAGVAHVPIRYLALLAVPRHQTIIPAVSPILSVHDVRVVATLIVVAALVTAGVRARTRAPLVTLGFVWFGLALVPSSGLSLLVQTGQLMAEHRVYLASCGIFLVVGAAIGGLTEANRRLLWQLVAGGTIVLTILTVLTIARNQVWSDAVRLWEEAARLAPTTPAAQLGLADAYRDAGDCVAAEPIYNRAIELRPDWSDPYLSAAGCFIRRHRVDAARTTLRAAIRRVPRNDLRVAVALASVEAGSLGNREEALRLCRDALAIQPHNADAQDCVRRYQANTAGPR